MKCISIFKCKPQIEVIDKSHCNLEDVPNFQSYSRSLEELFLDANKLTLLNENVFRLTKLRRFSFSDNGVLDIPPDIAKLVNLVELDCSRNRIQIIPEQIKFLRGLQVCDFSGNDIEYLPSGLVQLKNLTLLTLNYCLIKDLPEDIGQLKNLESLELRENEIETLPASITGLESLKKLDLGRNLISKLPDDIGRLKNLEYLLLDANRLTTVPSKIGRLENLQCLDLSKQELGFTRLPEEISGLTSLTDLHLSENHLTSLPDGISELSNLTILKADSNMLSDLNPNIGGCVSLQELVLTSNEITKLPSSIGNLIDLRSINVDDNMLNELPSEIRNLKRLGILSLRDNLLTHLPNEIGQLDSARVIDLSSNQLEYLPISITALNLNALWLSKNQAQPLPKLQIDELPNGTRVLTCYLLPQICESGYSKEQEQFDINTGESQQTRPAAVSFDTAVIDDSENPHDVNFVRHDTPHPHELRKRHPKLFNGGQVKEQQHELKGHDNEGFNINADNNHNSQFNPQQYDYGYESNGLPEVPTDVSSPHKPQQLIHNGDKNKHMRQSFNSDDYNNKDQDLGSTNNNNAITNDNGCYVIDFIVRRSKNHRPGLGLSIAGGKDTPPFKDNDEGIFVSKVTQNGPAEAAGVHVGDKILAVNNHHFYEGITHHEAVEVFRCLKSDCAEFTMRVSRDPNIVFANDQEHQQFEIIDGPINNQSTISSRPDSPPRLSKSIAPNSKNSNQLDSRTYTIPIQSEKETSTNGNYKGNSLSRQYSSGLPSKLEKSRSTIQDGNTGGVNIIYATLVKDYKHELGIELEYRSDEIDNQRSSGCSNIVITDILPDSIASRDGKLQIDDMLLSINGTDVTGIDLHRVKSMLNGTDRFIRIVVSRGDLNDPIGAALRNVPIKPALGSWFSSTSNVTNRPSLIESYQRPTFGSVTNLQNNNNANNHSKNHSQAMDSVSATVKKPLSKPPKPPKPVHLLTTEAELDSSHDDSESPARDLQSASYEPGPVVRPSSRRRSFADDLEDVQSLENTLDGQEQLPDDQAKRAAWRKERLKSIDDDVEMAKVIAELHRRRNEDRNS